MNNLISKFQEHKICDRDNLSELHKTDERYARHLWGIKIWLHDGVCYEYIGKNIKKYLSIETNNKNLTIKLNLMIIIDEQLKRMLKK